MKSIVRVTSVGLCAVLLGCTPEQNNAVLEKRIGELETQLAQSSQSLGLLQNQVKELKSAKELNDIVKEIDRIAYLTPGAEGYSTLRFDLGILTVQMVDVQAYANGSKVTLRFGNTLSSSINGLKATIEWGAVDEKGMPLSLDMKKKTMTFSETLRSGAWTGVQVILEGRSPANLGYVRVKDVSHTGIQLSR